MRLLRSHHLVSISHCSLTVKLHDQRCHPKPTLLMYKSSLGSDYHSVLAACATVALFLLTAPFFPLLFFLQVSFCTHKTDVKCTRYMLYPRQIRSSCIQTRVHIRKILQTSACSPCPHHLHRSLCDSKRLRRREGGNTCEKVPWSGLFCCQKRPD